MFARLDKHLDVPAKSCRPHVVSFFFFVHTNSCFLICSQNLLDHNQEKTSIIFIVSCRDERKRKKSLARISTIAQTAIHTKNRDIPVGSSGQREKEVS